MSDQKSSAIRIEDVSMSFGGRQVLKDISFQVGRGEALCILGRSGRGKSVLLRLMIGLLKPDTGKIFIEQEEITCKCKADLFVARKRVGFLFQDGALFDSISLGENIAFPLRRHTDKSREEIDSIVNEKLKQVGLQTDKDKMPAELSGGMRKRAGLARALALDPAILLVDEPGSGLDVITAREIDDVLRDLKEAKKHTLVIVTHDVSGVRRYAEWFAVIDGEHLVACDAPDKLEKSDNDLVRQLVAGAQR
jgi:phospholipid/cholesterol/gamma-HCH transport system ATP-binding protein